MSWTLGGSNPSGYTVGVSSESTLSGIDYGPTGPSWTQTTSAASSNHLILTKTASEPSTLSPGKTQAATNLYSPGYVDYEAGLGPAVVNYTSRLSLFSNQGPALAGAGFIEYNTPSTLISRRFVRFGNTYYGNYIGGVSIDGQSYFTPQSPGSPATPPSTPAAVIVTTPNVTASSAGALLQVRSGSPSSTTYYVSFGIGSPTPSQTLTRGSIYTPGSSTVYATSSDHRLKDKITPLDPNEELTKINNLRPRRWKWVENDQPGTGFVAHEVQEDFPAALEEGFVSGTKDKIIKKGHLIYTATGEYVDTYEQIDDVTGEVTIHPQIIDEPTAEEVTAYADEGKEWVYCPEHDTPEYQSLDSSFLVSPLVAAVQALTARVESLESRVAALEAV